MAAAVQKKLNDGVTLDELTDEEHLELYREAERRRSLRTDAECRAEYQDMMEAYERRKRLRIEALNLEPGRLYWEAKKKADKAGALSEA